MSRARNKPRETPENRMEEIGRNLRNLRKRRGLTQKGLSEKIGVSRETVASYESGRARLLDLTIVDLSVALGVSANDILGLEKRLPEASFPGGRWAKRLSAIESLPEPVKKHILRALDDLIKANTRLSIFDDP